MRSAVLPPHINESFKDFTVLEVRFRFGLAAVKNVGDSAIEATPGNERKGGFLTPY